jgi:hypothetical protein
MNAPNPEIVAKEHSVESEQYALVASRVVVNTEEDYQTAATALIDVKNRYKAIDALRREFVDPLNAHVKKINDFFREPKNHLERAENALKQAMKGFRDRAAAEQQKALAAAQTAAQNNDRKSFAALVQSASAHGPPEAAGVHTVTRWKYEIVDASQIPREFMTPDLQKIGTVVQTHKADTKIPGVRVYADESIVARGR